MRRWHARRRRPGKRRLPSYGNAWHVVMAVSTTALLPMISLFFIAQRYFVRGITLTGLARR